jgi:hypothetical protein
MTTERHNDDVGRVHRARAGPLSVSTQRERVMRLPTFRSGPSGCVTDCRMRPVGTRDPDTPAACGASHPGLPQHRTWGAPTTENVRGPLTRSAPWTSQMRRRYGRRFGFGTRPSPRRPAWLTKYGKPRPTLNRARHRDSHRAAARYNAAVRRIPYPETEQIRTICNAIVAYGQLPQWAIASRPWVVCRS